MKKRKLGNLEVSALGFGCMGLSYAYRPAMEAASYKCDPNSGRTAS